jgi:hypothetical protein
VQDIQQRKSTKSLLAALDPGYLYQQVVIDVSRSSHAGKAFFTYPFTRSPVVPTYLPVDMVTSERQAPSQAELIRGQVMQHMCQDALPPPLGPSISRPV